MFFLLTLIPKKGPDHVLCLLRATDDNLPGNLKVFYIGEFREGSFEDEFRTLMRTVDDRTVLCTIQTPIIASNVAGIADAFKDLPGCYLIDRDEPRQFEEAVEKATGDSPEMPREVSADRFDMHGNYAKYAAIYAELRSPRHS